MFHVERHGERVSVLRMDDGKVNAMGPSFLDDFPKAWSEATAGGRAVVIAGNARVFSAGLDLKVLPTLGEDGLKEFFVKFVRFMRDGYTLDAPVVTAVDGPALAGGAIVALFGDVRFGSPAARVGLTEMPVGIPFPPPVLTLARNELAANALGPAVFQGAVSEGEAARAGGWVHRVVPRETLLDEAVRTADELAGFNRRAYKLSKRNLRGVVAESVREFEANGVDDYVADLVHEDTVNAIVAHFARVTGKA